MPGFQELIVIAVVALLVFGPDRLPELARNAGRWVGRFRAATQRNVAELNNMGEIQALQAELRELRQEFDRSQPGGRPGGVSRAAGGGRGASRSGAHAGRGRPFGGAAGMGAMTLVTRPDDLPAPTDPDAT